MASGEKVFKVVSSAAKDLGDSSRKAAIVWTGKGDSEYTGDGASTTHAPFERLFEGTPRPADDAVEEIE